MPRTRVDYATDNITVYRYCLYGCRYCYAWNIKLFRKRIEKGRYDPVEEAKKYLNKSGRVIVVSFTCVPANTPIFTPNGIRYIEQISVGDRVYGLNGVTTVLRVFKRSYSGWAIKIKPEYLPSQIFTPEHPILIYEQHKKIQSKDDWYNIVKKGSRWINAGAIQIIHDKHLNPIKRYFVVIPKYMFQTEEDIHIDFRKYASPEYGFEKAKGKNELYREFLENGKVTEDFAWLMGLFVADGAISSTAIVLYLGNDNKNKMVLKKVERIVSNMGLSLEEYDCGGYLRIYIPSRILMRFFEDVIYCEPKRGRPRKKQVPPFMFKAKKNIVKAFLEGYIAGDGSVWKHSRSGKYIECISSEPELLYQIQMLTFKIGMLTSFYVTKRANTFKPSNPYLYHLRIRVDRHLTRYIETNEYYLIPIRKVEKVWYEGYVYNLETESKTYNIPYIVHNCDPYPYFEAEEGLTRLVLLVLAENPRNRVLILTKNPELALRDIDLMKLHGDMWLGTTITTLSHKEALELEPLAPDPKTRLKALREAKTRGIKTWISIEPIIHYITYPEDIIEQTIDFVDWCVLGAYNYNHLIKLPRVNRYIPEEGKFTKTELTVWYNHHVSKAIELLKKHRKSLFIKKELKRYLTQEVIK